MKLLLPSQIREVLKEEEQPFILVYMDDLRLYHDQLEILQQAMLQCRCYTQVILANELSFPFLTEEFGIVGSPTYLLIHRGKVLEEVAGAIGLGRAFELFTSAKDRHSKQKVDGGEVAQEPQPMHQRRTPPVH